jgi:hypothetical protein
MKEIGIKIDNVPEKFEWVTRGYVDDDGTIFLPSILGFTREAVGFFLAAHDGIRFISRFGHCYFEAYWMLENCQDETGKKVIQKIIRRVGELE